MGMKRGIKSQMKFLALALLATALCLSLAAAQEPAPPAPDFTKLGRTFILELTTGQFDKAAEQFDAAMSQALPEEKLAQTWSSLVAQFGSLKAIQEVRVVPQQKYKVAYVTCQFEKSTLDAKIVFSADAKIAGLFFVPAEQAAGSNSAAPGGWTAPAYAMPNSFRETPIKIADLHWELPGTLTAPVGNGRFPAVVLVAGSGPHDEDETIGANKPFKDLAWGLASRGIVVLRYTKRTAKYGMKSTDDANTLTVKDEVIDDARAAVAFAALQQNVDPKRVYLLGHSLGAYLAPRIATGDPRIAGIILLAGNIRPTEQLIVEQVRYLTSRNGTVSPEARKQIDAAEQVQREVENPNLKPGTMIEVFGSQMPSSYWLDLRGYNPGQMAAALKIPILVLQGEKDYQVRVADFEGWKKALTGHSNATFKIYPGLNHLFMISTATGDQLSTPSDYNKVGHVSPDVVGDIATWISSPGPLSK
jgi:dienelactone hydrolase